MNPSPAIPVQHSFLQPQMHFPNQYFNDYSNILLVDPMSNLQCQSHMMQLQQLRRENQAIFANNQDNVNAWQQDEYAKFREEQIVSGIVLNLALIDRFYD